MCSTVFAVRLRCVFVCTQVEQRCTPTVWQWSRLQRFGLTPSWPCPWISTTTSSHITSGPYLGYIHLHKHTHTHVFSDQTPERFPCWCSLVELVWHRFQTLVLSLFVFLCVSFVSSTWRSFIDRLDVLCVDRSVSQDKQGLMTMNEKPSESKKIIFKPTDSQIWLAECSPPPDGMNRGSIIIPSC